MTNVYRKPTFSGVNANFDDSFLPYTYKIGMVYTFIKRCFWLCSSWSMFQINTFTRDISEKVAIQKTSLIDILSYS